MPIHSFETVLQQMLHAIYEDLEAAGKAGNLLNKYELIFNNYRVTTEMANDIYINALKSK